MIQIPDSMKAMNRDRLRAAVRVMRDACDDAERIIASDRSDLAAAARVLGLFANGWANASCSLGGAITFIDDLTEKPE